MISRRARCPDHAFAPAKAHITDGVATGSDAGELQPRTLPRKRPRRHSKDRQRSQHTDAARLHAGAAVQSTGSAPQMEGSAERHENPAAPSQPQLPEVDSPPPEDVLKDAPSTDEIIEHAESAEEIVDQQPSVDDLLRRRP